MEEDWRRQRVGEEIVRTNTKKSSGRKKLMHKLMKILHGKDHQEERKERGGSSEPSSSNTGAHSVEKPAPIVLSTSPRP
ncbi:unnamed protein product [Microthlaspi erraticum]|uniref:Uncharacterized protein n=1 Tax=Microthlaspi erraticum TaxID=1685480 RepID=A0A6D2JLM6_9BRAS|nr:unnamed protein product [Microthlaspi erraticum]